MSASIWWLVATGASLALGVPQAWRLATTRSTAGVHYAQDLIRVAGKIAWLVYALAVGDLLFGVSQIVVAVPSLVTLALLLRWKALPPRIAGTVPAAASTVSGAFVWLGATAALGHLVAVSDVARYLPQARRALTAVSLHGVASGTYVVQAVAALGWVGYSWQQELWPRLWSNAIMLPIAAFILLRILADRRADADREATT